MIKKTKWILVIVLLGMVGFAQQAKPQYMQRLLNRYDSGWSRVVEYPATLEELIQKAKENHPDALNLMGIMYAQGVNGIEKNEKKAFDYFSKSEKLGNPEAIINLGSYYKEGRACKRNLGKAIELFTKASNTGNSWGTFMLGLMYYTAQGVPQSYEKAISYFLKSDYPMSKHYLGYCYYFGYGVPKNEDKALEYFGSIEKYVPNSEYVLNSIVKDAKTKMANMIADQIKIIETPQNEAIASTSIESLKKEVVSDLSNDPKSTNLKLLNGKWKGKLVILDYSGKHIVHVLPFTCELKEVDGSLKYKWLIAGKTQEGEGKWQDNTLSFKNLVMSLDDPFSGEARDFIDWQIQSAKMEFKTINNKPYLTAKVATYNQNWGADGPPTKLILKPEASNEESTLTTEHLVAFTNQAEEFIVSYPNPFDTEMAVMYELENDAQVNVQVYDFNRNTKVFEQQTVTQTKGKHKCMVNGGSLEQGLYVVRVTVDNKVYSRIVIKN